MKLNFSNWHVFPYIIFSNRFWCHYCNHFIFFFYSLEYSIFKLISFLLVNLLLCFTFPYSSFSQLPYFQCICCSMASSSSRKRRERSPSPSKGESSFNSAQGESQRVIERPTLCLQDPWYTPSLVFPLVSHGKAPPPPHTWVFSSQAGFANFAQVSDLREISDLQIRRDLERRFPFSSTSFLGRSLAGPFGWTGNFLTKNL